jgi:hypothetical protein
MPRRALLPGLVLAALAVASPTLADSTPEDRAAADALYDEAGNLMKAERWGEACPKLEASLKLDAGIGTTLRLGYCYEKVGRTASAWTFYNDAESMARKAGDKRAAEAARHAKQIEPLLSRLVLDVAPENRTGGVEIRRDGKAIDAGAWSSAIPLDPGEHVIEASAVGRVAWRVTIRIEAKPGALNVRVPPLAPAPIEPVAAAAPAPFWNGQRLAGVTLGGVGVAGLIVGAAFGGLAIAKKNASNADGHCDAKDTCDATGLGLRADSMRAGNLSTGLFIAGGAFAAGGLIAFLTTRTSTPQASGTGASVRVEVGLGDVRLIGRF